MTKPNEEKKRIFKFFGVDTKMKEEMTSAKTIGNKN